MLPSLFRPLSVGFVSLALLGAGCSAPSSSALYGYCVNQTPWGSCIDHQGIDPALMGAWRLESQTLATPQGTITNPFSGRMLTFKVEPFTLVDDVTGASSTVADLQYVEDWSSETSPNSTNCTVSGTSGGTWQTRGALNLDTDPPTPYYELEISTDPANPRVVCEGGAGPVQNNAASSPLGLGPGSVPLPGGFAQSEYSYTVAGGVLTITNTDSAITNTYVFRR